MTLRNRANGERVFERLTMPTLGVGGLACRRLVVSETLPLTTGTERPTRFAQPLDGFGELPRHQALFRIPEVQAVCHGHWQRAHARQIARRLGDCLLRATARVEPRIARIAVGGHRHALRRSVNSQHRRGRIARPEHRIALHGRVVLPIGKAPRAVVGRRKQPS